MNSTLFFENFELLADSPNGVQKLRELILQLAVMGKLVPQDPNDEPASVLLEKIKAEKKKLVREKIIRADSFAQIEEDEILFKIPNSWEWVRLGQIGDWGAGSTPNRRNPDYFGGTIKWFKSGELNDGYITDSEEKITDLALRDYSLRLNKKDDVLIAMYGATIGKTAILDTEATTNQAVCACTCFTGVYNRYLFFLLKAYRNHFISQGAGGAQPNISRIKIVNAVAPLPPLAEQKRIVSKVDELIALCDKLEARRQKKQELQSKLNGAALDRMLSAENQKEFEQNWQRICENFDLLYDNPENVEKLKKAILQLAVQGKLVEQNPEDEPASVLIEKIEAEKKKLVKEGKIKTKSSSIIGQNETDQSKMICCLPSGWEWIRLEDLGEFCGGGTPSTNNLEYWGGNIAWVSPKDMKESIIKRSEMKITEKALEETRLQLIPKNSILIVARSGILKRLLPVSINDIECTVNQDLKVIVPFYPEISNYIQLMLKGYESFILKHLVKVGMTVQSLKYNEFEKYPFPIPPFAEQKRIVEKVDALMNLCNQLEEKIGDSQKNVETLMDAFLIEAVREFK